MSHDALEGRTTSPPPANTAASRTQQQDPVSSVAGPVGAVIPQFLLGLSDRADSSSSYTYVPFIHTTTLTLQRILQYRE
jgi:hypothetical protein